MHPLTRLMVCANVEACAMCLSAAQPQSHSLHADWLYGTFTNWCSKTGHGTQTTTGGSTTCCGRSAVHTDCSSYWPSVDCAHDRGTCYTGGVPFTVAHACRDLPRRLSLHGLHTRASCTASGGTVPIVPRIQKRVKQHAAGCRMQPSHFSRTRPTLTTTQTWCRNGPPAPQPTTPNTPATCNVETYPKIRH